MRQEARSMFEIIVTITNTYIKVDLQFNLNKSTYGIVDTNQILIYTHILFHDFDGIIVFSPLLFAEFHHRRSPTEERAK